MADDDDDKGKGGGGDRVAALEGQLADARRKLRAANERITELQGQITDLEPRAQSSETLTRRIAELEGERDRERAGRTADRALAGKGIVDPEGIDLVHLQYGRLDPKGRPEFGAWLDAQTADPGKTPKWLAPYLPKADAGASGAGAGASGTTGGGTAGGASAGAAAAARPNPNGGVASGTTPAGASGRPSDAEFQAARAAALRGDRTAWDAMQVRLGQAPLTTTLDGK